MVEVLEVGFLAEKPCMGIEGSKTDLFLTLNLVEEYFELKQPENIIFDERLLLLRLHHTVLAGLLSGDHVH